MGGLPSAVPSHVRQTLRVCLRKSVRERIPDVGAVRLALEGAFDTAAAAASVVGLTPTPSPLWRRALPLAATALVVGVMAGVVGWRLQPPPPPAPLVRSTLLPPPDVTVAETSLAVSPDGRRVAFVAANRDATRRLWVRPLDGVSAAPMAGTDGAFGPFWSPDSQSLGFFTDGKLKRIDAAGGPVLSIADTWQPADETRGASWGASGVIVFAPSGNSTLKRVSEAGGAVTDATTLADGETTHRRPAFLPDGRHFVFSAGVVASPAPKAIRVGSLEGPDSTVVIEEADSGAVYDAGALLYVRRGTLFAQPLDVGHLALAGDAVPLVDGVPDGGVPTINRFSAAQGLLIHATGSSRSDLTWFDRTGNRTGELGEPGRFVSLGFSGDRRSLVVTLVDPESQVRNVWLVDVARGLRTRLTSENTRALATLSPDGKMVFSAFDRTDAPGIVRMPADGVGSEALLAAAAVDGDWLTISPDGRVLLYGAAGNLWALPDPLGAPGTSMPRPLFQTGFSGAFLQFSPDGRWIAYQSNSTARDEVYVMPYPGPGPSRQISLAGGRRPRWRGDGKEIFFVAPDGRLAAAEVSVRNGTLESGEPQMLFNPRTVDGPIYSYDVSADGQRILAITRRDTTEGLTMVQNWPALVKK